MKNFPFVPSIEVKIEEERREWGEERKGKSCGRKEMSESGAGNRE